MKKLPIYIIGLLCAVSCIYPFTADIESTIEDRIVISGDIRVGDYTVIDLGYVMTLDGYPENEKYPSGSAYIENTAGQVFKPLSFKKHAFTFDTRTGDRKAEYRLHITVASTGKEYVTPWLKVHAAPQITDFRTEVEGDNVFLMLSLDGADDSRYFVWDYEETWEFHADFVPDYMYDPTGPENAPWRERLPEEDYYYCWQGATSTESILASSASSTANKLKDFSFLRIGRSNKRLQVLYSIELDLRAVSEDAYTFIDNMNANSNNTGSLFSPVPSDVRGNIRCMADTNEIVIGFVDAYVPVKERFFIDNSKTHYFNGAAVSPTSVFYVPEPDEDGVIDYAQEYLFGNSPYGYYSLTLGAAEQFCWAPTRCLDCRAAGGTKTKPSYWPNDHK